MGKRGRKPSKTRTGYFYENEEKAVLDYLNTDDAAEKNRIYIETLKPAFEKMIECIIRRYNLKIPNEEYEDTFNDTLSNLLTKMSKFEPGKYKAYSYYGTVCKNYLIGRIQNYTKEIQRNPSYDNEDEKEMIAENIQYSTSNDKSARIASETINVYIKRLDVMINDPKKNGLKNNELKLAKALKLLLENWDYVLTTDGSDKLNKNAILLFLREATGFDTKCIRDNMKRFKKEFLIIKNDVVS